MYPNAEFVHYFFLLCWFFANLLEAKPLEHTRYSPVIHLNNGLGTVRGLVVEADGRRLVNFYQGIRYGYAERFQKPKPVKPWIGVYNATRWRFACPQPGMIPASSQSESNPSNDLKIGIYSEDCLFLNIWQPVKPKTLHHKITKTSSKAVMVWIHGGAFVSGTIFSVQYDARQIAALGDVVVVAIGYRLGPFGFLNGGTRDESGNSGLYDQVLALQWVQRHIDRFEGDPKRVTIFGQSSGAMSVGMLTLSPLTSGLFQRVIIQSGSPNSMLGSETKEISLKKTQLLATKLGCLPSPLSLAVDCITTKSASEIVQASKDDFQKLILMLPVYGETLLPISPVQALRQFNRPLDLLFGVVRDEGSLFVSYFFPQLSLIDDSQLSVELVRKAIHAMVERANLPNNVSGMVAEHYTFKLNENSTPKQLRTAISDTFGDFSLVCPTLLFGEQIARRLTLHTSGTDSDLRHLVRSNRVYAYRVMTPIESPFIECSIETMGVCHGQDNVYLFGHPISFNGVPPFGNFSEHQIELSRHMISAWTQFANSGQIDHISGVEWKQVHTSWQHNNHFGVNHFSFDFGVDDRERKMSNYKMVENYWDESCGKLWKPIIFQ